MQEKESTLVVQCELKIPSLGITVRHHLANLMMPNSYSHHGIFNPHLVTIKDSYNLQSLTVSLGNFADTAHKTLESMYI